VTSAFSLPAQDIKTILLWVQQKGGVGASKLRLSPCQCRVDFNATLGQLETPLDAEYFVYKHKDTSETTVVCNEYNLPDHILPLIDFVVPTVFPFREMQLVESFNSIDFAEVQLPSLSKRQQAIDCS